jgi:diguanylate cyclase (GGDEF)-like protein/PAS domain S-box-containing protein
MTIKLPDAPDGGDWGVLDMAPVLIWHAGIDTRCDWFNKAWLAFTGRCLDQELGVGWAEGVHPDDIDRCVATYLDAFHARRAFEMEYRLRHHSGEYRLIVDQGIPQRSSAGEFAGYVGFCFDLSEHKRTEERLRASEGLLRDAHEVAQLGYYVYELASDTWTSSPLLDRIFGIDDAYPRDVAHWLGLVHGEERSEMAQYLASRIDTRQHFDREFRIVRPVDGAVRWVAALGKLEFDAAGHPLRMIGTIRDVTSRKEAHAALQLSASVFEQCQEGILITDADRRIVTANAAFTRSLGYRLDELLGRSPGVLKSGLQDAQFYRQMWDSIAETGRWRGELWDRKKNGELVPLLMSINAVRQGGGEITHYIALSYDISDLKQTQAHLEHLVNYDTLTDLPNRILLADRLTQAMVQARRYEKLLGLCFVDLDGFKAVNDGHGHEVGDRLLIEVARRLSRVLREGDTVARWGGDEFVLMFPELESAAEIEAILGRVLAEAGALYPAGAGRHASISVSIGVTFFSTDVTDAETLLRRADLAMYEAKREGGNCYRVYAGGVA